MVRIDYMKNFSFNEKTYIITFFKDGSHEIEEVFYFEPIFDKMEIIIDDNMEIDSFCLEKRMECLKQIRKNKNFPKLGFTKQKL